MARNTTPVKPTTTGRHVRTRKGVDPREPMTAVMNSAREYGNRSPAKGKVFKPEGRT